MDWALVPLRLCYAFDVELEANLPAQGPKLSKITIIFTSVVSRKMTFTDMMQITLGYARAFKESYGTQNVVACILHNVEGMKFSIFLSSNSSSIYARYTRVTKKVGKNQIMFSLLVKLGEDSPAAKTLSIARADDSSLNIPFKKNTLLMLQAVDSFAKNDHESTIFYATSTSRQARALSNGL